MAGKKGKEKKNETAMTVVKSTSLAEAKEYAEIFFDSGLFQDTKALSQAIVKIQAGSEIGLAPFESMSSLDIIQGNITLSGNIQAAKIKSNPKYDYKIIQSDDKICEIEFFQGGESIGISRYTFEEISKITFWDKKEGRKKLTEKDNWKNYPSDMLFNRCISRGRKRYCPDVFGGVKVYDPEELNQDNEPKNITPTTQPKVVKHTSKPIEESTTISSADDVIPEPEIQDAEFKDVDEDDKRTEEPMEQSVEQEISEVDEEDGQEDAEEEPPKTYKIKGVKKDTAPREALDKILDYSFRHQLLDQVKPVIIKHYEPYADGSRHPYHIPEANIIAIVKELAGVTLKKHEKSKTCKNKSCKNKVTEPEAEEQDGLCFDCWMEANQD